MCNREKSKWYKVLELKNNSDFNEIKSAYLQLKKTYSDRTFLSGSMFSDITEQHRLNILKEIECAYHGLKKSFYPDNKEKNEKNAERENLMRKIPEFESYSGDALRIIRKVLQIEIEEIAIAIGVSQSQIRCIELEEYKNLPPKAYIKAMVRKYAQFLSVDPQKVSDDYVRRMEKNLSEPEF